MNYQKYLSQKQSISPPPPPILEIVVGSTLHGTSVNDGLEDIDLMSVVIENPDQALGLEPLDTWVARTKPEGVRSEAGDVDHTTYGLRKFLKLALACNPTILLAFFAPGPFVRRRDARGEELQALHGKIITDRVYDTFRGYLKQQHERLLGLRGQRNVTRPELVDRFGYDTKYAAHIVRLGYQGEEILTTGRITLPMPDAAREHVLGVRRGAFSLEQVSRFVLQARTRLDGAFALTSLPHEPDREAVERWMVDQYVQAWR